MAAKKRDHKIKIACRATAEGRSAVREGLPVSATYYALLEIDEPKIVALLRQALG
jgi:hypothetical protein